MQEIKQGFIIFLFFSILTGFVYPVFITSASQIFWKDKAHGSLIKINEKTIGSKLIGQKFISSRYFHGRPSAVDYKGSISGASNLGPTSKKLIEQTKQEINRIKIENNLSVNTKIPADLVFSSASGLDPHISPEAAYLQAARVASERGISLEEVRRLILKNIEVSRFRFLGQSRVNILNLNLALDENSK